jgi:hypothetical protein
MGIIPIHPRKNYISIFKNILHEIQQTNVTERLLEKYGSNHIVQQKIYTGFSYPLSKRTLFVPCDGGRRGEDSLRPGRIPINHPEKGIIRFHEVDKKKRCRHIRVDIAIIPSN